MYYSGLSKVGVQAGSYVFSDWTSHLIEGIEVFDYALTVLTRCVSRPNLTEAIFDSGMNSCSDENGENYASIVGPKQGKTIWEWEQDALYNVEAGPAGQALERSPC
jgi:D-serine deaminase-like pyridoxal phosphate-dependent protein